MFFGGLFVLAVAYFAYGHWTRSQLANVLQDHDPVIRMDAVRKTSQEGVLIEALHDDDPDIRYVAALRLGGDGSKKKVRALLDLFKDDCAYVRQGALRTLRFLPAGPRTYIYEGLEDADPRVRAGAAYSLVYITRRRHDMGGDPPPPRPHGEDKTIARLMIPLMRDEDLQVRKAAYHCLFTYWLDDDDSQQVVSALEVVPAETDKDAQDLADRLLQWMKQRKPSRYRDPGEE